MAGTSLLELVGMWVMALVYGTGVFFHLVKTIVTEGPRVVFRKVKRDRPACLQDPVLGTHGFLKAEDISIHYVASGPEDKPLMLFVHGFPEFWFSWRNQIREFQKDYRVVAIDMRGYGESHKPAGLDAYNMTFLMKDLKNVIEALGYKSCVLVGHDWGGAVTWAFGRVYPDYVDQLIVLNSPPSQIFRKILKTSTKQRKMSWYMMFFQLPWLPETLLGMKDNAALDQILGTKSEQVSLTASLTEEEKQKTGQTIEAYKYTFSQPGAWTPPLNFYRAAFRSSPRLSYDMDFSIPVLLIWGCKDMALSREIPETVEKNCPKITVKFIEDGSHFVQMDKPEKVNELMRAWLTNQASEGNSKKE